MAWIEKLPPRRNQRPHEFRWKVGYRDPAGKRHFQTFDRRKDADDFAASIETDKKRNEYQDPKLRQVTLGEYWPRFLDSKPRRPATRDLYTRLFSSYIEPTFGNRIMSTITPEDIQGWLSRLQGAGTGQATVSAAYRTLRAVLKRALASRHLTWDPTMAVEAPPPPERGMRFLDAGEVARLADAAPERYRALIYLLVYGGLRIGEAAALRTTDIDLRGRVSVTKSVTEVGGRLEEGPPKSKDSIRTITLPPFLKQMIDVHRAMFPSAEGYLFPGASGGQLRPNNFRKRVFDKAAKASGLAPLRPHDLRHTCASLLVAQGAHVREIAARLGHSNPMVTMRVYAHILPSLDERLSEGLEQTFQAAVTYPSPEAEEARVVELGDR
jgi:integrase